MSARLADSRANADANNTQVAGPSRSHSLQVAVPVKNLSASHTSSSRSSVENGSGSTPATSVAITPVESDGNRPNKRVSASARAAELRSSTMSLGTQRGRKRGLSGFTKEDMDEALARALQAEEYRAINPKRQKRSPDEDMIDEDDITVYGTSGFESPDSEYEKARPRDKNGKNIYSGPRIVLGPDSEDEMLDSDTLDSEDELMFMSEEEVPPPPPPARNVNARNPRSRKGTRVSTIGKPFWMSNRVSRKPFSQIQIPLLISYVGMEGTEEARRPAPVY